VSNGNEGHSRRQVLTTVGSLSIAGAMGQAIASSSLVSPAAAAQPNSEIAERTFEATADNVVKYARSSLRRQSRQAAKSYQGVRSAGHICRRTGGSGIFALAAIFRTADRGGRAVFPGRW